VNSIVTDLIADLAKTEINAESSIIGSDANLGRVRESLKHFVRDWSEEGREERDRMFKPILDIFREIDVNERSSQKVLVPGCGLGRLAWEISELGFDTTANELSYFMTLALRFYYPPRPHNSQMNMPFVHMLTGSPTNSQ